MSSGRSSFTGWGRTSATMATQARADSIEDLRQIVMTSGNRGIIARGLGRSYGDAAQNAGGTVLDMTGWDEVLGIDTEARTLTVRSGASIDQLMRRLAPLGLWLPVIPGTRQVTIGGAIAADIHGKNHHRRGSFGNHVLSLDLLTASGDILTLTPDDALFWATIGGMGMTGIVTTATITLVDVETTSFVVDTVKVGHLDELLSTLSTHDDDYEYSVAWFDTATRGRRLARAVITRGDQARISDLPPSARADALQMDPPQLGTVPRPLPNGLVNALSARAFNALWFAKAPHRSRDVQSLTQFLHPLDTVSQWNRVYGSAGFCQYQFVVPFAATEALVEIVETIAASVHVSSLNVLKRFGDGNRAVMSFPMAGWTLAVDLPLRPGLGPLLDKLDAIVVNAGGRVYLAKDSRLNAATLHAMYPRLDEFSSIRATIDPHGTFQSDLARRLHICSKGSA